MKIKSIIALLLIALLSVTTDYCKIKNPIDGAKLIINFDLLKTYVNLQFTDAKTGDLIGFTGDVEVTVSIMGENSDAVVDNSGVIRESFSSANGFLGLALNPNTEFVPSVSNPIKFTVVATLDGYISTSKSMTILAEGTYNEKIVMTDISNPPDGVVVKEEKGVGSLVDGTVQEDIAVKTQGDEVGISIPAGTVIRDGNGNTLSGSLDITLVYFDNLKDESLASFPGGLMTTIYQDGQSQDGAFFSAGFLALEISDQNGVSAKTFEENTLGLSMGIQAATYNPETQATIAAGDDLPVYSYDPDNGQWTYEQTVSVESGGRSDFTVTAQLSHLSYWNFDWFWSEYCDEGIQFLFTGDFGGCSCTTQFGIMRKQADNTFFSYIDLYGCENELIQTYYAPANMPVYIEWVNSGCFNTIVDEDFTYIENLCAPDVVELNLITLGANTTTVTIDVMGRCASNPDVEIRPTYGGWFRPVDEYCWRWEFMTNGIAQICDVEIGKEYVIGTYFNGQWYEMNYIVEQDMIVEWDIDLPDDFCSQVF